MQRGSKRSPDGAERNPGLPRGVDAAPDFAALHPGYDRYDPRHARARRGHPRLYGVRQIEDVNGRNKSGHDGERRQAACSLKPICYTLAQPYRAPT